MAVKIHCSSILARSRQQSRNLPPSKFVVRRRDYRRNTLTIISRGKACEHGLTYLAMQGRRNEHKSESFYGTKYSCSVSQSSGHVDKVWFLLLTRTRSSWRFLPIIGFLSGSPRQKRRKMLKHFVRNVQKILLYPFIASPAISLSCFRAGCQNIASWSNTENSIGHVL